VNAVSDVDEMWNDDAEILAFPEPEDEYEDLPAIRRWAVTGSNRRPLRCKRSALPLS
jgi:hypothetical protein